MKGLIAAGGKATRLRPITHAVNKHLIPVANKPLIEYAIEKMANAGIKEIAINVNPGEVEIQRALGNGERWGVQLTYLEQTGGPRGVGHIVMNAQPWIGDSSFVFYLGDNIVLGPIGPLIERFEKEQLDCLLALAQVDQPNRFGVPEMKDRKIVRVIEKPENPPSSFAVTGIYVYGPAVFEAAAGITPSTRGEYEISDIHTKMIEEGKKVGCQEVTGWWMDTGKPDDLLKGNALLLAQMPNPEIAKEAMIGPHVTIEGVVSVGPRTRITGKSAIKGPVAIGADCVIADSAVGPDASVGSRVSIDGGTVLRSLIMDDAIIQGTCRVSDSIIGRFARITIQSSSHCASSRFLLGDHGVVEL